MIHHGELALALAHGGAAPYLARVLRVITQHLQIDGAMLVALEEREIDLIATCGLPLHALRLTNLEDKGYKLLRAGARISNAHLDPLLADKPFIGTAPYWRSVFVVSILSPIRGLDLRLIGGSADPQPPPVAMLLSEHFHDLKRILAEELRLITDVALAVTEAAALGSPRLDNRVAEPQLPFQGQCGSDVVVRFLLDTLLTRPRVRSRRGLSYHALRTWRKAIKAEQVAAIKAIKTCSNPQLEAQICLDIAQWIESTLGAKRFDGIVPVPCGHSGEDCLTARVARQLAERLGTPLVEAFAPIGVSGSSHPKTNRTRPAMRLRQQVDGDVLLIDDIATSGAHLEEAMRKLRHADNSVIAVSWLADA